MKKIMFLALSALIFAGAGCSFAPTQVTQVNEPGWATSTSSDGLFTFDYPTTFGETVWHPLESVGWPPKVTKVAPGQDAVVAGCSSDLSGNNAKETAFETNGLRVRKLTSSDAGAGNLYDAYCYVIPSPDRGSYAVYFVIWSHTGCGDGQCGAYCETQNEAECRALDRQVDITAPIDRMAETFLIN